jgi:hypothetical protein
MREESIGGTDLFRDALVRKPVQDSVQGSSGGQSSLLALSDWKVSIVRTDPFTLYLYDPFTVNVRRRDLGSRLVAARVPVARRKRGKRWLRFGNARSSASLCYWCWIAVRRPGVTPLQLGSLVSLCQTTNTFSTINHAAKAGSRTRSLNCNPAMMRLSPRAVG